RVIRINHLLEKSPNYVKQKKTHLLQLEKLKSENKNLTTPDFTNYRKPASEIPESEEEETLDNPIEIDFVKKKEPITSIATISVKIKYLKIPAMVLDIKYDLSSFATVSTESISVTHNFPITLLPGFTINEDFAVKYKCAVDWGNNKIKIHYNGEDFIIPEVDSDEDDNVSLEEYKTSTKSAKKKCMSYDELEKSIYTTLKSKAEINDLCEKLQMCYEKLLEHISTRDNIID
ncbi:3525_t:CDS:2, partial [Cetraspora pellucida]